MISIATTFAMTPFILRSLGESAFGVWVLANVLVSYGTLLDLGIGSGIIKYVADAKVRTDAEAAHRLLATATRLYVCLALIAAAMGVLVATVGTRLIGLQSSTETEARAVLALMTVSFVVNLVATPATATLRGLQRYDITNAITVANVLTTAALTIVVLKQGGGVVAMVAVTVPVSVCTQLVAVTALRKLDPDFALRWTPGSRAVARALTGFGVTLTVSQLAVLLQKKSSEIIIAAVMTVSAVAPYALARRLSELPHVISDQFIKVLLPVTSELHSTGAAAALQRVYLVSTRITLALMIPLALGLSFLAGDLLELWVGEEYRDQAVLVVVLVIASVAFTSQWPAGSVFQGMARFRPFAFAALVSGAANVCLTMVLIRYYGLIGVVVGTLVPTVLEALGFALPYTLRQLDVRLTSVVREVLVPVCLPAVPCIAVLLWAERLAGGPSWPALLSTGGAATAAYALTYLLMPAASQERQLASRLIKRGAGRST